MLAKDTASPFAPESDDEKKKEEPKKEEAKKDEPKKEEAKKDDKVETKVDLSGIDQRILALPLPAVHYVAMKAGKAGMVFAIEAPPNLAEGEPTYTVRRFDFGKRKADIALGGVKYFDVSSTGDKILYQQGDKWAIADTPGVPDGGANTPPPGNEKTLRTGELEVRVDPAAEWKQMFRETWRIERDYFYDPHYHGLDLNAAEERYSVYLSGLASRADLNYLMAEMLGNFTVGHMFLGGGDRPEVKHIATGLLGADYKVENGRFRIARIYNGENWNPDLKAPLTQPGLNVAVGDYLLAVNGRELRATDNLYSFFEATAGKTVSLKIGPDASGANSREVKVMPVEDESRLRHLAWVEGNRRKVDQATNGRVACIHMPDTARGGYTSFMRYFFAQVGKDAATHLMKKALQSRRRARDRYCGVPAAQADERRDQPYGRGFHSATGRHIWP